MRDARGAAIGGGAAIALVLLAWMAGRASHLAGGFGLPEYLLLGGVALGLLAIAAAVLAMDASSAASSGCAAPCSSPPAWARPPRPGDPGRRDRSAAAGGGQPDRPERDRRGLLDRLLDAVLGAIGDGIVVVTSQGQASLINAAGKLLLGGGTVLGASLFDVFERESLAFAMTLAEADGPPRRTMLRMVDGREIEAGVAGLGPGGGAVLRFAAAEGIVPRLLEHDLGLHDLPPVAGKPGEATPLDELPVVSLDTETTGLDVRRDRLLSVGAVHLHGHRLYLGETFDRMVNPAQRIPPGSTAIHSITDAMIADAPDYASTAADLARFCGERVWVGHNIGFDAAILRREAKLAGLSWSEPVMLDTLRLYAALYPRAPDVELDAVAGELGVDVIGRHTALGDALVTAEVYRRLLPLLAEAGVATLEQALAFAERPHMIRRLQQALGW